MVERSSRFPRLSTTAIAAAVPFLLACGSGAQAAEPVQPAPSATAADKATQCVVPTKNNVYVSALCLPDGSIVEMKSSLDPKQKGKLYANVYKNATDFLQGHVEGESVEVDLNLPGDHIFVHRYDKTEYDIYTGNNQIQKVTEEKVA